MSIQCDTPIRQSVRIASLGRKDVARLVAFRTECIRLTTCFSTERSIPDRMLANLDMMFSIHFKKL
jgi:hypothetical protein